MLNRGRFQKACVNVLFFRLRGMALDSSLTRKILERVHTYPREWASTVSYKGHFERETKNGIDCTK